MTNISQHKITYFTKKHEEITCAIPYIAEDETEIFESTVSKLESGWIQIHFENGDEHYSKAYRSSEIIGFRIDEAEFDNVWINGYQNLSFLNEYKQRVIDFLRFKLREGKKHMILFANEVVGKTTLTRILKENGIDVIEEHHYEQSFENPISDYHIIDFKEMDAIHHPDADRDAYGRYKLWK